MPFFSKNLFLLLGTIIGAGIFSLPLALKTSGWLVFLFFLVFLSALIIKINCYFREIVESIPERHQLKGYVLHILGNNWSNLALFLHLFSIFGSMLAYLILGGKFLAGINIQSPQNNSLIFWLFSTVLLLFAGRWLELVDVVFTFVKVILLGILTYLAIFSGVKEAAIMPIGKEIIFCYGAVLFALTGFSIIPELKKDKHIFRAIAFSQIIVGLLYVFFAFTTVKLVSGDTLDFLVSWQKTLFNWAGVITVFTPYLMMAWVGYDSFDKDLGFPKKDSLVLMVSVPLLLFLLGFQNFMAVVSVTGGVSLGGIGIIISRMYQKRFPGKETLLNYLIQAVFLVGVAAEIVQFIK